MSTKGLRELYVLAVSNALYGVAGYAQGKELLDGIHAMAAVLAGIHVEKTSQALATKLADPVAERLNEEIETQMINLEKNLEEKMSIVLSMFDQAHDKIQQATAALEKATSRASTYNREHDHTPHLPHASGTSSPHANASYASVVHSHLPTSHLSNLAR